LSKGTQKEAADLVTQILKQTGRIDALVNNAGIIRRAPAVGFSEADWNEVLQTNLSAPFFLCQAIAKWWLTQGRAPRWILPKLDSGGEEQREALAALVSNRNRVSVFRGGAADGRSGCPGVAANQCRC
jgi:NAD(P)-dependent dehydrogenase (short-subunit alcohol dehydrogenase family)